MTLNGDENNQTIMREMGQRVQDSRIAMNMTQTQMAERSGVALRTVSRIENGESVNFENILNVLRVLGMLGNLNQLIQEQVIAPTEMADRGSKKRKRATAAKKRPEKEVWVWGDEK